MIKYVLLLFIGLVMLSCRKDDYSYLDIDFENLLGKWYLERLESDSSLIRSHNGNLYLDPDECSCIFLDEGSKYNSDYNKLQGILYNCDKNIDYYGWKLYSNYIGIDANTSNLLSKYYIDYFTKDSLVLSTLGNKFIFSRYDRFNTCSLTYMYKLTALFPDSSLLFSYRNESGYMIEEILNVNSWSKEVAPNHTGSIQQQFRYDFTIKSNPNFQYSMPTNLEVEVNLSIYNEEGRRVSTKTGNVCIQGTDLSPCSQDSVAITLNCQTF